MKRFVLASAAVLCATAVSPFVKGTPPAVQDRLFDNGLTSDQPLPVVGADKPQAVPVDEATQLRKQLVQLVSARAEIMTLQELRTAVARAEAENDRVVAQRELERAAAILHEIADKHPGTPAGKAALRAKRALDQLEPEPDPGFRRPEPREHSMFDEPTLPSPDSPIQRSSKQPPHDPFKALLPATDPKESTKKK